MGGKPFRGPGVGFGVGVGCGFGVGWGFGGGDINLLGMGAGGGCGVGVGLGWGYGAAWGSKYIIIDPEFESSSSKSKGPRWLSQLREQLHIAKFEKAVQRQSSQQQ